MELVKGVPITEFCDDNQLTPRQRLELFLHVCQAVQHAHQKGIIHRDLKPSNILVVMHDTTPVVKVIDFGVAKALGQELTEKTLFTGFAQMVGTPLYMSPEQAGQSGLDIDTRSDIYSLGVLLYELLTGMTPFSRERFSKAAYEEIRRIIRDEEPPKPSTRLSQATETLTSVSAQRQTEPARLTRLMRGELDWIVMKALEKDRSRRYETAAGLAQDIQRYLADEPVQASPPSTRYRLRKFARRNKAAVVMASVVALAALVAVSSLAVSYLRVEESLQQEQLAKEELAQSLYYQWIASAAHARERNRNGRAEEMLELCPSRFHGWEWHYLRRLPFAEFPPLPHDETVIRVAWSRDGRLLASGDLDGVVKTWDARTGKKLFATAPPTHRRLVHGLVFSPDGQFLAEGGQDDRGVVNLWDPWTGKPIRELQTEHRVLIALAVSPDSQQLAAAFQDRNVCLWDVPSGRELWCHQDDPPVFNGLAFTSDGKRFLSVSAKGIVTVRDRTSGQLVSTSHTGFGPLVCAGFSQDSRLVALGSELGTVKVVQAETCKEICPPLEGHTSKILGLAFAAGDKRLATSAQDLTVKIWDLKTGKEALNLYTTNEGRVYSLAFSPDGNRLAAGDAAHAVKVLDGRPLTGSAQGGAIKTLGGHTHSVVRVVFSRDGGRVASASLDKTAKVWDAHTGRELHTLRGHEAALTSVAFSRDGRRIASASLDETVRVWDGDTGAEILCLRGEAGAVYDVAFNHDGSALASAHYDGTVKVWDPVTGQRLRSIPAHSYPVLAVAFSPDGQLLASAGGQEHTVKLWDASTGTFAPVGRPLIGPTAATWSTAFSSDARFVVSMIRTPGKLWLWDVTADKEPGVIPKKPRVIDIGGRIFQAVVSPDDGRLAVVHADRVQLLDMTTEQTLSELQGHHAGDLWSVAFSPDGQRLATGAGYNGKGEVRIWDPSLWKKSAVNGEPQPPD
jgi:WD40 repeat protein